MDIRFLCLCPTYNRPKKLIDETIENFKKQKHTNAFLLIYDDLGSHEQIVESNYALITNKMREPGLIKKYDKMLQIAKNLTEFNALAIWDDDDIYLPNHLYNHNIILQNHGLSYPSKVWSTYTGKREIEESGGRFWASLAVKYDDFLKLGGFIQTDRADFDQQSLGHWRKNTSCGDPCKIGDPTYVFRWSDTGCYHSQFQMKTPDDTEWYQRLEVKNG
jgi:glycosyltransferase involved in cell wall biosynthesis